MTTGLQVAPPSTRTGGFSEAVQSLARALQEAEGPGRPGLSRGDRAELRRMGTRGRLPPEVYWRLASKHEMLDRNYTFWSKVVPLMVRYPHSRGVRPGRALAQADVSPGRVERWLRLDREGALREAGRLLSKLKEGIDWGQLAWLLSSWDDASRLRFAKDFYLAPEKNGKG